MKQDMIVILDMGSTENTVVDGSAVEVDPAIYDCRFPVMSNMKVLENHSMKSSSKSRSVQLKSFSAFSHVSDFLRPVSGTFEHICGQAP